MNTNIINNNFFNKIKPVKGFRRFDYPESSYKDFVKKEIIQVNNIRDNHKVVFNKLKSAEYNNSRLNEFSLHYKGNKPNNFSKQESVNFDLKTSRENPYCFDSIKNPIKHCDNKEMYKLYNKPMKKPHKFLDNEWICNDAKTISNLSSVDYNLINHDANFPAKKIDVGIKNFSILHKQKSISEYSDLLSDNHCRVDKNFKESLEKQPNLNKIYTGIFTNMYDASIRNGSLSVPFRRVKKSKNSY